MLFFVNRSKKKPPEEKKEEKDTPCRRIINKLKIEDEALKLERRRAFQKDLRFKLK